MKKACPFLLFFLGAIAFSAAQGPAGGCAGSTEGVYLHGNNVRAHISNAGTLFLDGEKAAFNVPFRYPLKSTIYAQGLWLAGLGTDGALKLAASSNRIKRGEFEYFPGPLDSLGSTTSENCADWDRIWQAHRLQIEAHREDFAEDGVIDNPIPEILGWPGKGNPHFQERYGFELPDTPQGLAPFFDHNSDGRYTPLEGDYPALPGIAIVPEHITWNVFNDAGGPHTESHGAPLQVEVQLTSWAFNCADNPQLNNTIFASYKVINRGQEAIDSLALGLWLDFMLGCFRDDHQGSAPELNTVFTYNHDNIDGSSLGGCTEEGNFGENPPVQAVTCLNQDLSSAMVFFNSSLIDTHYELYFPTEPQQYFNFLNGRWRFGAPLTYGGYGFNPGQDRPPASFCFPGDPNDPSAWSSHHSSILAYDQNILPSIRLGGLFPDESRQIDVAYSYFREPGADYLENVTVMYAGIEALQEWYDNQFESACAPAPFCEENCIWAGDANADGIANHCDLLAIAVAEGQRGPTRNAPYNWSPQPGEDWEDEQSNGANNKHLDADGSGTVAFEDFRLSHLHYNLTRSGYQPPPPVYREGPELVFDAVGTFNFNNLSAGQSTGLGRLRLMADIPELYALAFSLEYDTAYFEAIYGQYPGYNPDTRTFMTGPADRAASLQFDYARVAPEGFAGEGRLTLLQIKVKESFLYPLPSDTTLIRFKNIKAIRRDGSEIEIGGNAVVARFPGIAVAAEEAPENPDILFFPNPADGRLEVRFPGRQAEGIEVLDVAGKRVWYGEGLFVDSAGLDLGGLPGGVYFVRLQIGGAAVVRRVVLR